MSVRVKTLFKFQQQFRQSTVFAFSMLLILFAVPFSLLADDGDEDLEKAIELKSNAASVRDLDKVVELCESAIEKGLDESSEKTARLFIKSALVEHVTQLHEEVFNPRKRTSNWRFKRREALLRIKKLLEADPQNAKAHLMRAEFSLAPGGDRDLATGSIDKAIEFAGDDKAQLAKALLLRASLAEDEDTKLSDLNQAIKIDTEGTDALMQRGQYWMRKADFEQAADDFKMVIDRKQDVGVGVYHLLIRNLIADDKMEEAREFIDKAIEVDPKSSTTYVLRAIIQVNDDDMDAGLEDINKALELNPRDMEALLQKANVLLDKQDYDGALEAADAALVYQPGSVQGIMYRSLAYAGKEDYKKAVDDMQLLVDSFPTDVRYKLQMGMYYNAGDEPEKAIKLYDELLEDEPENASILRSRGDAFLSTGEHAKAIADYENAIELQGDEPDAGTVNNLAWVLATSLDDEIRDGKRSVELGLQAAELSEYNESYILSTLAAGYAEAGDFENAIKWGIKSVERGEEEESDSLDNLKRELEGYRQDKAWREDLSKDFAGPVGSDGKAPEKSDDEKSDDEKSEDSDSEDSDSEKEDADSEDSDSEDSDSEDSDSKDSDSKDSEPEDDN